MTRYAPICPMTCQSGRVCLIVWCRDCSHQVEPDLPNWPDAMATQYRDRLVRAAAPVGPLFFEPNPRPAIASVAGVKKDYTGSVEGPLNGVQGRAA
jgi:hypothetical protein